MCHASLPKLHLLASYTVCDVSPLSSIYRVNPLHSTSSTSIQLPMMTPPSNPLFTSVRPMGTGGTSCCPRNSCQQPQQYLPQSCIFTPSLPLDNSKPTITVSLSYNSFQSSPIVFPSHSTHLKDHSWRESIFQHPKTYFALWDKK